MIIIASFNIVLLGIFYAMRYFLGSNIFTLLYFLAYFFTFADERPYPFLPPSTPPETVDNKIISWHNLLDNFMVINISDGYCRNSSAWSPIKDFNGPGKKHNNT